FSSRRRHTRWPRDWSSDVCSSDLEFGWKYMPEERSTARQLLLVAKLKGTDAMLRKYDELKNSSDPKKRPEEFVLNMLGYQSLQSGKTDEAIKLFARNVEEFPQSGNVYDSLGE